MPRIAFGVVGRQDTQPQLIAKFQIHAHEFHPNLPGPLTASEYPGPNGTGRPSACLARYEYDC